MKDSKKARFDTRLPVEQKALFERATELGGYKTLSEFVLQSAQSAAEQIIEKNDRIIASQRDQQIFFQYVFEGIAPNEALKSALEDYKAKF